MIKKDEEFMVVEMYEDEKEIYKGKKKEFHIKRTGKNENCQTSTCAFLFGGILNLYWKKKIIWLEVMYYFCFAVFFFRVI